MKVDKNTFFALFTHYSSELTVLIQYLLMFCTLVLTHKRMWFGTEKAVAWILLNCSVFFLSRIAPAPYSQVHYGCSAATTSFRYCTALVGFQV